MAFVDFESEDAVNQCIEKFNQKKLYANRIRICKKIDKSQLNEYKANTRFIRCLNPECYNQKSIDEVIQQLSNWFTKFGSVYTFKFGEKDDKWTGYGWVSFETKEAAAKVQEYSHENDNSEMAAWKIVFSKYESERPSDQKNLYL